MCGHGLVVLGHAEPFERGPAAVVDRDRAVGVAGEPTRDLGAVEDGGGKRTGQVFAALCPVETVAEQRPTGLRDLDTQLGENVPPVRGDRETV